ncbi:WAT1-related protein [Carex littledalei]|uniref:WAT1-related protein n=1 Tax=Carex littledalei TaxID=544730 RepID=A0A833RCY8_9POAL|nr:WAT1-related protein [Carex littledalei]
MLCSSATHLASGSGPIDKKQKQIAQPDTPLGDTSSKKKTGELMSLSDRPARTGTAIPAIPTKDKHASDYSPTRVPTSDKTGNGETHLQIQNPTPTFSQQHIPPIHITGQTQLEAFLFGPSPQPNPNPQISQTPQITTQASFTSNPNPNPTLNPNPNLISNLSPILTPNSHPILASPSLPPQRDPLTKTESASSLIRHLNKELGASSNPIQISESNASSENQLLEPGTCNLASDGDFISAPNLNHEPQPSDPMVPEPLQDNQSEPTEDSEPFEDSEPMEDDNTEEQWADYAEVQDDNLEDNEEEINATNWEEEIAQPMLPLPSRLVNPNDLDDLDSLSSQTWDSSDMDAELRDYENMLRAEKEARKDEEEAYLSSLADPVQAHLQSNLSPPLVPDPDPQQDPLLLVPETPLPQDPLQGPATKGQLPSFSSLTTQGGTATMPEPLPASDFRPASEPPTASDAPHTEPLPTPDQRHTEPPAPDMPPTQPSPAPPLRRSVRISKRATPKSYAPDRKKRKEPKAGPSTPDPSRSAQILRALQDETLEANPLNQSVADQIGKKQNLTQELYTRPEWVDGSLNMGITIFGYFLTAPTLLSGHYTYEAFKIVKGMREAVYTAAPYAVMTLRFLSAAGLMAMLQSTLDSVHGVNSVVLTVYQQLASTSVLISLTLLFDQGRRKPSLQILSWICLIGFLQITVAELLLTSSLRYITATVQSIGLNIIPVAVFVLAVLVGREKFAWGSVYEQGKLWGVIISVVGATLVVLASDSDSSGDGGDIGASDEYLVGVLMVAVAVLILSAAYILVERMAIEYSSDLALSAMINLFGMIQTVIVAVLTVRDPSSWKINTDSLELIAILYGGIVVTGIFYFGQNWCIHTKGPVFVASFHPLLVVFSFIFEILFFQSQTINTKRLSLA